MRLMLVSALPFAVVQTSRLQFVVFDLVVCVWCSCCMSIAKVFHAASLSVVQVAARHVNQEYSARFESKKVSLQEAI